jgi:heavy metal sensor kinase
VPIRTRLTLVFAGLMVLVLVGSGLFIYVRFQADLRSAIDAGLRSRAQVLLAGIQGSGTPIGGGSQLIEPEEAFAQILAPDGTILDASSGLEGQSIVPRSTLSGLTGPRFVEVTIRGEDEPIPARLLVVPSGDGSVVVVGSSLEDSQEALGFLIRLLWVGGPVALGMTTVIAWLLAGAALRPVERMRVEAEALSVSEPARRLPVSGTRDEVARLGETLNRMLARLEEGLENERRFVADASHELRTPLAILKTELELALRRSRTPDELEAALRSAAEESERLSRLAEDLLVLARSDRGKLPVRRGSLEISELVSGVVERFARRAEERGVAIEQRVPATAVARVDRLRVEQAISNVLDNSLRHTPRGGKVGIDVTRDGEVLVVRVTDTGTGFAPDFLPRAFEPFTRTDGARGRNQGGAGLGLAIVRAVTEAHGGSVEARNLEQGGASVTMRLPS